MNLLCVHSAGPAGKPGRRHQAFHQLCGAGYTGARTWGGNPAAATAAAAATAGGSHACAFHSPAWAVAPCPTSRYTTPHDGSAT